MEKIKILFRDRFADILEAISQLPPNQQGNAQDQIIRFVDGINEIKETLFDREDVHRLMGAEIVLNEVTHKNEDFYVCLKVINKRTDADLPIIKINGDDMPAWYKKDMVN